MSVSYTRAMRARAKQDKRNLVTIAVPGMEYQGLVDAETVKLLIEWTTRRIFAKEKVKP